MELFADWIEAQAYLGNGALSQPEISDRIEGSGWVETSDDAFSFVADAFNLCRGRRKIVGNAYPFSIAGSSIEYDGGGLGYIFCLFASLPEQYKLLRTTYPTVFRDLFESLVAASLRTHLPGWDVYETGWGQRETRHKGAILDEVAAWSRGKVVNRAVFKSANDAQVDVALVREFPDGRAAFPVLLGQCATGITDWEDKTIRPNISRWRKALYFTAQPVGIFAVPFDLDDESFAEASDESDSLVLDRRRICQGLIEIDSEALRNAIAEWLGNATPLLPVAA